MKVLLASTSVLATVAVITPPADAATPPACSGGLCIFTGQSYTGSETFLQGNVPDLSVLGATTINSAKNGSSKCWLIFDGKNYKEIHTKIIAKAGSASPVFASSTWGSAEIFNGTCA